MNHEARHHTDGDSRQRIRIVRVRVVVRPDCDLIEEDSSHTEASEFVHVQALANVVVCGTGQLIASPGTWRIEAGHREEIIAEGRQSYDELVEILATLGVVLDLPFESVPWDESQLE